MMKILLITMLLLCGALTDPLVGVDLPPSLKVKVTKGYPKTMPNGLVIKNARFGTFVEGKSGSEFKVVSEIPLKEGAEFGWVLDVETSETTLWVEEILTLPEKPASWGATAASGESVISSDGKTATTKREYQVNGGIVENFWGIAEGDPAGEYTIVLKNEGEVVFEKTFKVRK